MYLDEHYIKILGSRLDRFKALSRGRYQCRCPICGDSKKDKKKARGNFYIWRGSWMFKCHNCGKSMGIPMLLENYFPDLYDEYLMGKNKDTTRKAKEDTARKDKESTAQSPKRSIDIDLPKLSDLPVDHPAVSYALGRKIPDKYLHDLYYAEKFKKWSNQVSPGSFSRPEFDDSRIVIPFRDEEGCIFAFQGRDLQKSKLKYLTVKIDQDAQKIYGLNTINPDKTVYVVEGPIDAMFLDNTIGTADSSLESVDSLFDEMVFIWDNEPRSAQITKKMEEAVNHGNKIVVWKKSTPFNDINDAFVHFGYTKEKITKLIKKRTFYGLEAILELNNWRKI